MFTLSSFVHSYFTLPIRAQQVENWNYAMRVLNFILSNASNVKNHTKMFAHMQMQTNANVKTRTYHYVAHDTHYDIMRTHVNCDSNCS